MPETQVANPHVQVVFDTSKMNEEQVKSLSAAESSLTKAAIIFDSYVGDEGIKSWQWDHSLKGPIRLEEKEVDPEMVKKYGRPGPYLRVVFCSARCRRSSEMQSWRLRVIYESGLIWILTVVHTW